MTTDTNTFTFERQFPLPPDEMWHLMTDPEARQGWGVPGENQVLEVYQSDLRVDGVDRHRCGPADNPEFEVETRWYRLDGPSDAVFTEVIEAGGMQLGASLVTYRLIADGAGTKAWVTVAVTSYVGPEMNDEFKSGWSGALDLLGELAKETTRAHA